MTSSALAKRPRASNLLRARVENVRITVPRVDWSRVRIFEKCMWRSYSRRRTELVLPRPVVLFSEHPQTGAVDSMVACLTETWQEMLGAISEEDVAEEGFDSRRAFKLYFAERYPKGGFRPLEKVQVYRIRPLTDEDREAWLDEMWQRLYGSFA